jgi:hypothetical protein
MAGWESDSRLAGSQAPPDGVVLRRVAERASQFATHSTCPTTTRYRDALSPDALLVASEGRFTKVPRHIRSGRLPSARGLPAPRATIHTVSRAEPTTTVCRLDLVAADLFAWPQIGRAGLFVLGRCPARVEPSAPTVGDGAASHYEELSAWAGPCDAPRAEVGSALLLEGRRRRMPSDVLPLVASPYSVPWGCC